jgi:hypothetical protein
MSDRTKLFWGWVGTIAGGLTVIIASYAIVMDIIRQVCER